MSASRSPPNEWILSRSGRRARSLVAVAIAVACALAAFRMRASPPGGAFVALAALMFAIAARPPGRSAMVRLEGTRAVATDGQQVLWSVERAAIRSVMLQRAGSGGGYEVLIMLHGGGALIVPARFDASEGYRFGNELWAALQALRAGDGYRG
jgi:hypothetical protein